MKRPHVLAWWRFYAWLVRNGSLHERDPCPCDIEPCECIADDRIAH